MMMLPTGIKELQSIDDVCYLRETLAVEKSEQVCKRTFHRMHFGRMDHFTELVISPNHFFPYVRFGEGKQPLGGVG